MSSGSICLLPQIQALAGPASFSARFKAGMARLGVEVHHDPQRSDTRAILIIAGTRHILPILQARRRGVRVVQRLNGINWIHRYRKTGWRHYLRAEAGNLLLAFTRRFLADFVVYQSHFAHRWWEQTFGKTPVKNTVIWNGVDLAEFSPHGEESPPIDRVRVQVVEGHLKGGFEIGLEIAAGFGAALQQKVNLPVEVVITGEVNQTHASRLVQTYPNLRIRLTGVVPPAQIPGLNRQAHLFLSTDLHAACPNSVIEALACGTPVAAFATGALPELVVGDSGRVVEYGNNPWRAELPRFEPLADAVLEILREPMRFRSIARRIAEEYFDLDQMCTAYRQVLLVP
ncbi:glycosyltransferase family 4 protein [Bellilinea sp.]|uniref:Glycosyltransferase n=1 Tax=Bellilinea caldifistulae TaxID=360411 RepID=A0A7C4L056_9CHLR|nr:glycosyltransferase family 4 protein [Bellilinea sp.]